MMRLLACYYHALPCLRSFISLIGVSFHFTPRRRRASLHHHACVICRCIDYAIYVARTTCRSRFFIYFLARDDDMGRLSYFITLHAGATLRSLFFLRATFREMLARRFSQPIFSLMSFARFVEG